MFFKVPEAPTKKEVVAPSPAVPQKVQRDEEAPQKKPVVAEGT